MEGEGKKPWTQDVKWWQALAIICISLLVGFIFFQSFRGPDGKNRGEWATLALYCGIGMLNGITGLVMLYKRRRSASKHISAAIGALTILCIAGMAAGCYVFLFIQRESGLHLSYASAMTSLIVGFVFRRLRADDVTKN